MFSALLLKQPILHPQPSQTCFLSSELYSCGYIGGFLASYCYCAYSGLHRPSFNGGYLIPDSPQQQRAIACTVLAMCSSTMGTFIVSMFLSKDWKIRPVDIQNATLAGGVAVGAVCHMTLRFSDSMLIGFAGGVISAVGYAKIQPFLEGLGLHDSCGINNLHGMPSLLGGAASIILVAYKGPKEHDYPAVLTHTESAYWHQLAAVGLTLVVAISSGLATGFILRLLKSSDDTLCYDDAPFWEVAEETYAPGEAVDIDEKQQSHQKPKSPRNAQPSSSQIHPFVVESMED